MSLPCWPSSGTSTFDLKVMSLNPGRASITFYTRKLMCACTRAYNGDENIVNKPSLSQLCTN